MYHENAKRLFGFLPRHPVALARTRAWFSRHRLPPGPLIALERVEKADRNFLIHQARAYGSVFKARAWGELWVCVVGLPACRRFLRDHVDDVDVYTLKLESLFPKGCVRQMQGEVHQRYRRALVRAIQPEDFEFHRSGLAQIADSGLAAYADHLGTDAFTPEKYIETLNGIASGMLIQLFFGANPGSGPYQRLLDGYRQLGPFGLVWNIGERQRQAYAGLYGLLRERVAGRAIEDSPALAHSVLGRVARAGDLDDDMLGNLIYMVEIGRFDLYSLFRWLTKHATDLPVWMDRIAADEPEGRVADWTPAEAFVVETLRMDQSERLLRRARKDFVFDGHFIPRNAMVRLCLWESHQSDTVFSRPFDFNPARFLERNYTADEFSPFGVDQHQCPFGEVSTRLGMIFLRALASGYTIEPSGDNLPVRGAYHWEPASQFTVRLSRKEAGALVARRPATPATDATDRGAPDSASAGPGDRRCPFHAAQ